MEDETEIDWEQISIPSQAHEEAQAHSRGRDGQRDYDDYSIFPPSNHEGLHIPLHHQPQHEQDDQVEYGPQELASSPSNVNVEVGPLHHPSDSRFSLAGDFVMKRLSLGFEILRSKFMRISSSARYYTVTRGANRSLATAAGVAAALLVSLLYLKWQRQRRRRLLQQNKDRLILLVQDQSEKINQVLDQISQLNELLSMGHRVPVLRRS